MNFSVGRLHVGTLGSNRSSALRIDSTRVRRTTLLACDSGLSSLGSYGAFVIAIPAPVSGCGRPSLAPLVGTSRAVKGILGGNSVIVCRSAICPNTARRSYIPMLRHISKLQFGVSFCTNCDPRQVGPKSGRRHIAAVGGIASKSAPRITSLISRLCGRVVVTKARGTDDVGITRTTGMVRGARHSLGVTLVGRLTLVFGGVNVSARTILRTTNAG